jgi:hypothetical protein
MNTDGISYLDVAGKFAHHDWLHGVNAYWSPLYPLLLSVGMQVLRPSPYWEFPAAHFVNFVIFLGSAAAFQFFLSRLLSYKHKLRKTSSPEGLTAIPDWAVRVIGYALFLWISLQLTPIAVVSPDMTVAALIYGASGVVLGLFSGLDRIRDYVLLGAILGFGYLAKAPLLPVAFVFLAIACFATGRFRPVTARLLMAFLTMVIVAAPFALALSHIERHLSWGESAKLNYAWYVNGLPRYHWHGEHQSGVATHPTKLLVEEPPVYSFDSPESATYSIWYDPTYWNAGIHLSADIKGIVRQFFENCLEYEKVICHDQASVVVICLLIILLSWQSQSTLQDIARYWMLLVPSTAALAMYAPVHVEPRMIAPFVLLFWMTIFVAVRFPKSPGLQRAASMALISLGIFSFVMQVASIFGEAASHNPRELLLLKSSSSNFEWQIADELHRIGVEPGDKVGWIRPAIFGNKQNYEWARLGGLSIVAEVPPGGESQFWSATPEKRSQVLEAVAQTGAVAFVVTDMPLGFPDGDWKRLGNSNYRAYLLRSREK